MVGTDVLVPGTYIYVVAHGDTDFLPSEVGPPRISQLQAHYYVSSPHKFIVEQ